MIPTFAAVAIVAVCSVCLVAVVRALWRVEDPITLPRDLAEQAAEWMDTMGCDMAQRLGERAKFDADYQQLQECRRRMAEALFPPRVIEP
jgi:TRAP-type C4-dicarboxylate transport system permease small subunit